MRAKVVEESGSALAGGVVAEFANEGAGDEVEGVEGDLVGVGGFEAVLDGLLRVAVRSARPLPWAAIQVAVLAAPNAIPRLPPEAMMTPTMAVLIRICSPGLWAPHEWPRILIAVARAEPGDAHANVHPLA